MRMPLIVRAVVTGILIGLVAANVWPFLLLSLGAPIASVVEIAFLAVYVWWAAGGGWPHSLSAVRKANFRATQLSAQQWLWGVLAALAFAASVHAAIVLLFRLVPFPTEAFHKGYDFSFIPSRSLQWLAVVVSALSAGVCEEVGFRGYMQRPIEAKQGPEVAILVSSLFFMLLHLNKDWALIGMVPIVFGAGVLLGTLARLSGTLLFCMLGHWIMDIGFFAYWWTQIAGTFQQRPIAETGIDEAFVVEALVFAGVLVALILAMVRLKALLPLAPI
jgi:membrane protease YdiL (CAAX protease family)